MAFEPINIFSHRIDPTGVAKLMRNLAPSATVHGPDDDWSTIDVITAKRGLLRREKKFTLGHDSDHYDSEGWTQQVMGMQGYFSEFPDTANKPDILRMIRSFRFCLAVPVEDLDIDSDDPRLDLLYGVCRHLDGVIFTPSSLRDSCGRILFNSQGTVAPDAVLPTLPATEDHPLAEEPDDDDDYEEPEPPTADRVARRTLALATVATRATLELDFKQGNLTSDDGEDHRKRLLDWAKSLDIDDEFEAQEWKVVQRPVGSLEQRDFINAMWRVEGLVVLAWSLKLHGVPAYDELVVPMELYEAIGVFESDAGKQLLANPKLRSPEEITAMVEHLLALHWRIRDFSIRPQPMDFVAFSKECWFGSFDLSQFRTVDGDLAIGDRAISDADPEEISRVGSLAMERHTAINWLRGYASTIYSEVTTDT